MVVVTGGTNAKGLTLDGLDGPPITDIMSTSFDLEFFRSVSSL